MIFYFTSTGNCLATAKELGRALHETCYSIPSLLKTYKRAYPHLGDEGLIEPARFEEHKFEDERLIFVVPVYGHDLPYLVQLFLRNFSFKGSYIAFVLTYGNRHGDVVDRVKELCTEASLVPDFVRTLLTIDNWLPDYDIAVQRRMDKRTKESLDAIIQAIEAREHSIEVVTETDIAAHRELLASGFRFLPWQIKDFLTVSDRCVGCGLCVRICPSGSMRMDGMKAQRQALAGWGCSACLGCINVCPSFAIECSFGEKNPSVHYRNDAVSVAELLAANEQS